MSKRLLLSSDDYIFEYNGSYYSATIGLYERYLRVFDILRVVARTQKVDSLPSKAFVQLDNKNIEIWPFPFFQGPKQFAKIYFKGRKKLKNVTKDCNAAILRIPSTTAYQVLKHVLRDKLPFGVEVVIDPYDSFLSTNNVMHKLYYKSWYNDLLKACKNAEGVSCVTKEYLQKRYFPSKKGAFTSYYSSISLPKDLFMSARKYPDKQVMTIAHVSNQIKFEGRKGHKELIQAVAIVNKRGYNVCVNFVGGDYNLGIDKATNFAESLGVADKIHFLGFLKSKKEVIDQLKKADLFVLPTKAEGLPRAIIEAMAVGLPCITTNVSGNPELIQKEFLVNDFYDVEDLAEKIIKLIIDPELYEVTSRYNFENSKNYEESILQQKRDEFYTKLRAVSR